MGKITKPYAHQTWPIANQLAHVLQVLLRTVSWAKGTGFFHYLVSFIYFPRLLPYRYFS